MRILKRFTDRDKADDVSKPAPQLAIGKMSTLVWIYIVLAICALVVLLPLVWLLFSSLKTQADLTMNTWGPPLSVLGLIYAAFRIPISIFILEGFMTSLPRELEECAFIDGCSVTRLFFKIIVPLSKDGIVTISILTVLASWNELLVSMLLLSKPEMKTLPIGLMGFITEFNSEYTQLAAGIMLAIIPSILFYIFAQEKIEKGMIAGAIKG